MRGKALSALLFAAVLLAGAARPTEAPPAPRGKDAAEAGPAFLLDGVTRIAAPGVPGPLCVFGPGAFPVVTGRAGRGASAAVVAAGRLGSGRVVVFGHGGYFDAAALDAGDTGRLLLNALRWASRRRRSGAGNPSSKGGSPREGPRVAVRGLPSLRSFLARRGIAAELLEGPRWTERLEAGSVSGHGGAAKKPAGAARNPGGRAGESAGARPAGKRPFDLLCVVPSGLSGAEIAAVARFVGRGGGLAAADLGWGWLQLHPGKRLATDHPGNRLLAQAGIVWADGTLERTAEGGFAAGKAPPPPVHAGRALEALIALDKGRRPLDGKEIAQAAWSVAAAARTLPPDDTILLPRIRSLMKSRAAAAVPTPSNPLTMKDPLARVALTLETEELKRLPPGKVRPHPAAASFPGAVPRSAPRVDRTVAIDLSRPGRHGTGLYAPPGEVIAVTLPEGTDPGGLAVRIGCHSDTLRRLDAWKRCPDICRVTPLEAGTTRAANAFGGLVYIECPGNGPGPAPFCIAGAVPAPRFVLGRTGLDEWRSRIRSLPAPWAELETDKVILTVPAKVVRRLDRPDETMLFWDRVLDACADLAGRPRARRRPERYVADVQISAGYMHSGYPIMTHLDIAPAMVDKHCLETNGHGGVWGLFHEMGHNHQAPEWTFDGAVEVTVNLFTLYVFETVCGIPIKGHDSFTGAARKRRIEKYLDGGGGFAEWKRDPFLALIMYIQLEEGFGWETYKKVFAEYRDMPASRRPRTDDAKRDEWLKRFSRAAGRNLGPFFAAWGVPVSKEAREAVSNLPEWMPPGFPPPGSPPAGVKREKGKPGPAALSPPGAKDAKGKKGKPAAAGKKSDPVKTP